MTVTVSQDAKSYITLLEAQSLNARKLMSALRADQYNTYSFYTSYNPKLEKFGCGQVTTQPPLKQSLWQWITNEKKSGSTAIIEVNPNCLVLFTDTQGKPFRPSTERLFAHELAHAYIYCKTKFLTGRSKEVVEYENIIAKEIDPNAPERAESDHTDWIDRLRENRR
jgi:hypothetical protein